MNNYMKVIINALKQWTTDMFSTVDQALENKVDAVDGKGLSTEDFTTEHKNKLESLDVGRQITEHNTSTEAHADIRESISDLSTLVGDAPVSEQITDAINGIEIPEVDYPVTSVNGMTGDVVIDIPEGFSGSWKDLEDKPFYEENNQTIIEWDGSTDARESFVVSDRTYYKISDNTPTADDIAASTFELSNGESVSVTSELFTGFTNGMAKIGDYLYVIDESTYTGGGDLSITYSDGIYACVIDGVYPSKFTYGATTIHQLEEKFIPDTIARVSELPEGFSGSWNDLEDKPFGDTEPIYETVVENVEVAMTAVPEDVGNYSNGGIVDYATDTMLIIGDKYKVVIDGVEYYGVAKSIYDEYVKVGAPSVNDYVTSDDAYIGNLGMGTGDFTNTGELYCIAYVSPESCQKSNDMTGYGITNYGFGSFNLYVDNSFTNSTVTVSIYKVVSDAQKIDSKYLHKPDWNQTDDLADDYIKNKPFERVGNKEVLCFDGTLTFDTGSTFANERPSSPFALNELSVDERFVVVWDDIRYECRGYVRHKNNDGVYIGNIKTYKSGYPFETDYPFAIWAGDSSAYVIEFRLPAAAESDETHTAQIYRVMGDYSFDKDFAKATQGDWEDNDTTSVNYIKNRPFYDEIKSDQYIISQDQRSYSPLVNGLNYVNVEMNGTPICGEKYYIEVKGYWRQCECKKLPEALSSLGQYYCGNLSLLNNIYNKDFEATGETFLIITLDTKEAMILSSDASLSESRQSYMSGPMYVHNTLHEQYLPANIVKGVKKDWAESRTSAPGYIQNRTHWESVTYGAGYDIYNVSLPYSHTVDGMTVRNSLPLSQKNFSYYPGTQYKITINNDTFLTTAAANGGIEIGSFHWYWIGNGHLCSAISDLCPDTGEDYVFASRTYQNAGYDHLFYTTREDETFDISLHSVFNYELHPLDEKFIPDTIARVSDIPDINAPKNEFILNSTTEGSSKKFKITIDDEGVLTATEIVESEA